LKSWTREDLNSWKRELKNEKKRIPAPPCPTPIYKLNMTSMIWNISIGQLGLAGHAPSQLLHTCSLAEYEKLKKVLDILATTENISVLPTIFSY